MNFDIDSIIFVGFLIANLLFGLVSSRGIKDIKEYAIGDRNFNTSTLVATIVATWISGSFFFNRLSESYSNGLYYMWSATGNVIELFIVGIIFAPRMLEFLGKLSIAEAMGVLFGQKIRVITAVAGFLGAAGLIAVQLRVAGLLFEYGFGISEIYGTVISAIIITLYSSLGGIKSVTFTDVIQLLTFGTIIPTIAFFVLSEMDSLDIVYTTLQHNELFDYKEVFNFSHPKSLYYLFLFFYMAIPAFNSAIFQRIAMAKNIIQVRNSFLIAGLVGLFITIIIFWISILVLSTNPELNPKHITKHILFNYSYVGIKGLTLVGIMAMVMSTADSYINTNAVLFIHDFCKPLKIKIFKNELYSSRIASCAIGIFALILAMRGDSILKIVIMANSFYMPIVTVPFIMAVFGFRSSSKSVFIGMGAGFITSCVWNILGITFIDSILPGMCANLALLIGSHYVLQQPGGWIKVDKNEQWQSLNSERQFKRQHFISSILNFSLTAFFKRNTPSHESIYVYVGFFCMITVYSTMHTLPKPIQLHYPELIKFITFSSLFASTILLGHPLWLSTWKGKTLLAGIIWNLVIFYVLICGGVAFLLMSNFAHLQLMIFMISVIVIASLLRWQWALFMVIIGALLTTYVFQIFLNPSPFEILDITLQYKIIYLLLLISSVLAVFIRPKQRHQELTEEKNDHLNSRISSQEEQVNEALALKGEFIRNVSHEYHAPMTGIISTVETLWESYDKLSEKQRRSAIETIYKSSHKLHSYDENITSLAKLSKGNFKLQLEQINLSKLLYERVEKCRKLYVEDKEAHEFIFDIKENVTIKGSAQYLGQMLDNLVINAITYCKKGKISINLQYNESSIYFTITDEGIGIPPLELLNIFGDFTVSSKTHTPAGGRGVGLALCKKIVEIHSGSIKAESNGRVGATFKVILPL